MAELQTTFSDDIAKGYPGMVANGETSNRITRSVEDAAGIAFGAACYRGALDHGCTATVGTLATFLGFAIAYHCQSAEPGDGSDSGYPERANAAILTGGAIYLEVTAAIADGTEITVATADGSLSGTAADATHIATGWIADETTTGAGLVRAAKR